MKNRRLNFQIKTLSMPRKRKPTDEDIAILADQFGQLWRPGDVLRPWFRQHQNMLLDLVHGAWSWESVGQALTKAGITYGTGKPWTAKWLQSDFSRAQQPLKAYGNNKPKPNSAPTPSTAAAALPAALIAPATPPPPKSGGPRFKTATFRVPEPPRALSEAERIEIERNRRLTFGSPDNKE
jgi:hypothetical protein